MSQNVGLVSDDYLCRYTSTPVTFGARTSKVSSCPDLLNRDRDDTIASITPRKTGFSAPCTILSSPDEESNSTISNLAEKIRDITCQTWEEIKNNQDVITCADYDSFLVWINKIDYFTGLKNIQPIEVSEAILDVDALREQGNIQEALKKYLKLLQKFQSDKESEMQKANLARINIGIGMCYTQLGQFLTGNHYLEKALEWTKQAPNDFCLNIAEIYRIYGANLDAMSVHKASLIFKQLSYHIKLSMSASCDDTKLLLYTGDLAISFAHLNQGPKARDISRKMQRLFSLKFGAQNPRTSYSHFFAGYIDYLLGDFVEAKKNLIKIEEIRNTNPTADIPSKSIIDKLLNSLPYVIASQDV
jgi:tetratricopeptide (TPR) repeat protein